MDNFGYGYYEDLLNCGSVDGVLNADYYNFNAFNAGGIMLDVDKSVINDDHSRLISSSNEMFDEVNQFNNVNKMSEFNDVNSVINNYGTNTVTRAPAADNSGFSESQKGVTVNFNAYNEIHSQGADVDSVLSAFGEKLAEAVGLIAEGVF